MASSETAQNSGAHDPSPHPTQGNVVEMNNLETSTSTGITSQSPLDSDSKATGSVPTAPSNTEMPQSSTISTDAPASDTAASAEPLSSTPASSTPATNTSGPPINPTPSRLDTVAIGPADDTSAPGATPAADETDPVCVITLLLGSGARHPYKLDERYLTKRNVTVPGVTENGKKDPFSISVYTLKELILREWRDDWEAQPSSPSSIRLIHFGRLLDDKTPLKECRFNADTPNVVHMSIKPQEMVDDEEASKSKATGRDRDGGEGTAGCRCVIL